MPLILPGNVTSATAAAYDVANSCRFNDADSPYMHKTFVSPTDNKKFTFSVWLKRGVLGAVMRIFERYWSGSGGQGYLEFTSGDVLKFYNYGTDSGTDDELITNRVFRDVAAWYHIVIVYDSANGTAGNRMRMYINGTEETSFSSDVNPGENESSSINVADVPHNIGYKDYNNTAYFDGYMAEVVFSDGQAYAASDFGEFDDDSPTIWKPKDVSGLTFGNNGFYLDFEASGNLGNDVNGGTDLTESGLAAVDQCTDSPTNNFVVMNPLDNLYQASAFSEGNCQVTTNAGYYSFNSSTMWLTAGKWYWEVRTTTNGSFAQTHGISGQVAVTSQDYCGRQAVAYSYYSVGKKVNNHTHVTTGYDPYGGADDYPNAVTTDIVGVALDLDNLKVYFAKNNTWQDSGDPTSGATGTGAAYTITAPSGVEMGGYSMCTSEFGSQSDVFEANFGNPVTALDSAAADENGYGAFEFAPPSGYLAICTKNLGSDGG